MKTPATPFLALLLLLLAAGGTLAQDPSAEPAEPGPESGTPETEVSVTDEPVIPSAYEVSRYEASWARNPFMLKTNTPVPTGPGWENDWALGGMFRNGGREQVTIVNKQTGETKRLSNPETKPDPEFKLVKLNFDRSRDKASAEVSKGDKPATIKYDENLTSKPVTIVNTGRAAGAPGGAPGAPGVPVRPTAGGQVQRPGGVTGANVRPGTPGATLPPMPNVPGTPPVSSMVPGAVPSSSSPTISRRRQLIPAPVAPAQP